MVWWRSGTRQTCCPLNHLQTHMCSFNPPVRHLMSQHQQVRSKTMRCVSTCARACAAGCWHSPSVANAISCTCTYACCCSASKEVSEVQFGFVCFTCIMTLGPAGADLHSTDAPFCGFDDTNSMASAVQAQPLQHQQPAPQSHNDSGSIPMLEHHQQPPSVSSSDASGISPGASGIPSDAHQQPNSTSQQQAEEACSDHQRSSELQQMHLSSIHQQPQRQQQWQQTQSQHSVDAQPSGQPQASSHSKQQQQPGSQYRPDNGATTKQMSADFSDQESRPVAVFASAVTGAGLPELLLELERKVCR